MEGAKAGKNTLLLRRNFNMTFETVDNILTISTDTVMNRRKR